MGDRGEKTRGRIVETACTLFHAKGYTNTSMDEIVRDAGVTKGNLYYYFSSKEALCRAVVECTVTELFATDEVDTNQDPVRGIVAMFRRTEKNLAAGQCKGGCLFGNLALEVSDLHDGMRQQLDRAFSMWEARIEQLLKSGKQRGVFRSELQPKSVAQFVIATLEGGILLSKVKRDVRALKSCTDTVERVLESFRA
jgi:TetR/AcrR family transcriptional repressor of nem operon